MARLVGGSTVFGETYFKAVTTTPEGQTTRNQEATEVGAVLFLVLLIGWACFITGVSVGRRLAVEEAKAKSLNVEELEDR
jgi:hypothetical protein